MKIAVLSGKGGAGKTLCAVNLAATLRKRAGSSVYIDCDVEEPNGHLFLPVDSPEKREVNALVPVFKESVCNGCRSCVDACRFNALFFVSDIPMVFTEVCHSCGLCAMVCPVDAIEEKPRQVGCLEIGESSGINVVTGVLNTGEASGVPVIQKAQSTGFSLGEDVVIDCPPGSACSATESIQEADYCVLVAEPTSFGFDNFKMVHTLTQVFNKPCGVVINKEEHAYDRLESYLEKEQLEVLARIPYRKDFASLIADGKLLVDESEDASKCFNRICEQLERR